MEESIYLFFDAQCVLCNNTVAFLLKNDRNRVFTFVSLSSGFAQKALAGKVESIKDSRSFLLLKSGKLYSESSAALMVGKYLPGVWRASQIFWIIPAFIRNVLYRFVAQNRYKWFGKQETCMLPTEETKSRFILS